MTLPTDNHRSAPLNEHWLHPIAVDSIEFSLQLAFVNTTSVYHRQSSPSVYVTQESHVRQRCRSVPAGRLRSGDHSDAAAARHHRHRAIQLASRHRPRQRSDHVRRAHTLLPRPGRRHRQRSAWRLQVATAANPPLTGLSIAHPQRRYNPFTFVLVFYQFFAIFSLLLIDFQPHFHCI